MKKIRVILTAVLSAALFTACGAPQTVSSTESTADDNDIVDSIGDEESATPESKAASLISPVSVYYGNLYENQMGSCYSDQGLDGYEDCIVIFDYTNDTKNRELPASGLEASRTKLYSNWQCQDVTLEVNGTNTYEAYDPNAYFRHYANAVKRYTDLKCPIDYGTLMGGADTVRMFAVFYVNPNELTPDSTAILTVQDQTAEVSFENITEIHYADEVLSCEENYEIAQQTAAFKWRMDKMAEVAGDADHYMATMSPGSDFSGFGTSVSNLFSTSYGVTISGLLSAGFDSDNNTFDGMTTDLPAFDPDVVMGALPDQASEISAFISSSTNLGNAIRDSGYSSSDVREILNEVVGHYANLLSAFDMDALEE